MMIWTMFVKACWNLVWTFFLHIQLETLQRTLILLCYNDLWEYRLNLLNWEIFPSARWWVILVTPEIWLLGEPCVLCVVLGTLLSKTVLQILVHWAQGSYRRRRRKAARVACKDGPFHTERIPLSNLFEATVMVLLDCACVLQGRTASCTEKGSKLVKFPLPALSRGPSPLLPPLSLPQCWFPLWL